MFCWCVDSVRSGFEAECFPALGAHVLSKMTRRVCWRNAVDNVMRLYRTEEEIH
jgi:hypothetical protein